MRMGKTVANFQTAFYFLKNIKVSFPIVLPWAGLEKLQKRSPVSYTKTVVGRQAD